MGQYLTPRMERILRCAVRAPSSHNSQPWKFSVCSEDCIIISPDYSRTLPVVDSSNRELFISLGCALENLVQTAGAEGFSTNVELFPQGTDEIRIGLFPGSQVKSGIIERIEQRQTTRTPFFERQIETEKLEWLQSTETEPGISLRIIQSGTGKKFIRDQILEANGIQMKNVAYKKELVRWIRVNRKEEEVNLDGLTYRTLGFPAIPASFMTHWIFSFLLNPRNQKTSVDKLLNNIPAYVMISSNEDNKTGWVRAGRFFERLALRATGMDLKLAHHNQPVEIPATRENLNRHFCPEGSWPELLLRLGYGPEVPQSPRRPLGEVVEVKGPMEKMSLTT